MKKRKLLCLLMASLVLAVPFSACDDKEKDITPQVTEHEIWSNFVMEEEKKAYSNVFKFDGDMTAYDAQHNLMVVETQDLDNNNNVTTKYTVYDVSQGDEGKSILTRSVTNLYNEEYPSSMSVSIQYPLIKVRETDYVSNTDTEDPDDKKERVRYTYYLIKEDNAQLLVSDVKNSDNFSVSMVENLYVCEIDDKVYWINQDIEILRTLNKIPVDSYDSLPLQFNAEFNDYLYMWCDDLTKPENLLTRFIQVYNKEGVCSMQYNFPSDVYKAFVSVLNNGNIFVQEHVVVEASNPEYDYKSYGNKFAMNSKIIDFKTGEVQELDLNFIVSKLQSEYAGQDNLSFPLQLKEGKQNQAYITYFNESGKANRSHYVILDNDMKVEYTVKNDTLDLLSDHDFEVLNKDYYIAEAVVKGIEGEYLFDMDGNIVSRLPENMIHITDEYIVTTNAIYDLKMNLVFDVEASMFGSNRGESYECEVLGDKIFMFADNYLTGIANETYIFDSEKKEPVLFSDGIKTDIDVEDGAYTVYDYVNDNISIYDESNNLLVKVQGDVDYNHMTTFEEAIVIELEVDGKDVCYVVRRA